MGSVACGIDDKTPSRRGAALLLVLWIIGLLGIIVVSFAWDANLEGKVASFARKRAKTDAIARSGMEIAKMLLNHASELPDEDDEDAAEHDAWLSDARALRNGQAVFKTDKLGDGAYRVDIVPVGSGGTQGDMGRNVNTLKDEDWERIFGNVLGLSEDLWPELIDSFNDWIDTDDIPRSNGAETEDYYATLDKPYSAKNGPLDTVRELLLIRGFSDAILSGGVLNPEDPETQWIVVSNGVQRVLSTRGDGKVNVNAVGNDQNGILLLMTLPGVDEIAAKAILEERENVTAATSDSDDTLYKSAEDFRVRVGEYLDDSSVYNYITVGMRENNSKNFFKITSVGMVDRVTRKIMAEVEVVNGEMRVLSWLEEP
jgi:general secretion pathway protein K